MISMFFSSLFRALLLHQFSKDFETDFGSFSMCFWYLFCLRTQLAKSSNTFVFTMNLHVFTHQKIMICDDLCDLFRYLFWHWFLINLDIDFASILAPVWYQIPSLFGDRFYIFLLHGIFIDLGAKCGPGCGLGCSPFHPFFDLVPQVVFLKVP